MSEKKKKDMPARSSPSRRRSACGGCRRRRKRRTSAGGWRRSSPSPGSRWSSLRAWPSWLSDGNDKYLRLAAEYDNYRKRTAKEKESIYADAKLDTVKPFLDVADNLDRAVSQFEEGDPHRQGMELICKQFAAVLEKLGVTEIPVAGADL